MSYLCRSRLIMLVTWQPVQLQRENSIQIATV